MAAALLAACALPAGAADPLATSVDGAEPLRLTLAGAVMTGLDHNRALRVERLTPGIRSAAVDEVRSMFDPALTAGLKHQDSLIEQLARGGAGTTTNNDSTTLSGTVALSAYLPSGMRLVLEGGTTLLDSSLYLNPFDQTRVGFTAIQPLLQGGRPRAVLAVLRQARIDVLSSRYELLGFAEALVARIEEAYRDYALAVRQVAVFEDSLRLAEDQLAETRERIRVGQIASVEIAAVEAEVAARREGLVVMRGLRDRRRLALLGLIQPPGGAWERPIEATEEPVLPAPETVPVAERVAAALRARPDLNQARLAVERGELEVVKTRNGLLPRLDLFVTLGRTGYADSFSGSVGDIPDDGHDAAVGVEFELPLGNRAPRARHTAARATLEQASEAVANLEHLVEMDVRSALVDMDRAREGIAASAATLAAREASMRAESEKFRVGKSTGILVARAQRDVLESRLAANASVAALLNALTALHRLEGSLLARRGLAIDEAGDAAVAR